MIWLDDNDLWFPPAGCANADGVVAVGGDLRPERLLLAYSQGIFPWFNAEEPPIWWSPDPRCVLYPERVRVSKSMRQVARAGQFELRVDTAFEAVMQACAAAPRPGNAGTWITEEFLRSYTTLHRMGYAHSAETWCDGELVGGLYGIRMGRVFCGESMFARESNASKFALIGYAEWLAQDGVAVIDCQVENPHLLSLGAEMVERAALLRMLA